MLSIVVPAHNEEASIEATLAGIEEAVGFEHETVVVNDCSTDETKSIVEGLMKKHKAIRLLNRDGDPGFRNALIAGFSEAAGDVVVPMMADLCDDPKDIKAMMEEIEKGYDVVCGSRYISDGRSVDAPLVKSFFSRLTGYLAHVLVGVPTMDATNAYKAYRKDVIDAVNIQGESFEISMELAVKAQLMGYKITETPTTWRNRQEGESKFKLLVQAPRYVRWITYGLLHRLWPHS